MGESNEWNKVKFTFNKNRRRKNHFKTKQKYTLWENYNVLSTKSSVIFTVKKILMQSSRVFRNRPISSVTCITGGTRFRIVYNMAAKANTKCGILPCYFESLQQKESKERYREKLKSIEGQDPYEISRKKWIFCLLRARTPRNNRWTIKA